MDHDPVLEPMLRKLRLWVNLDTASEQALLDLPHSVVMIEKNKSVVREGDDVSHAWLVLSGFCVRLKYVGTGGRQWQLSTQSGHSHRAGIHRDRLSFKGV